VDRLRRTFNIEMRGEKRAVLTRVRRRAARQGIKLVGDETVGSFMGIVSGNYVVQERKVKVTITHKPFFLTWENVQHWLEASIMRPSRLPGLGQEADGGLAQIGEDASPRAD